MGENEQVAPAQLGRRALLRTGAVAATAAGLGVGAAVGAPAAAADPAPSVALGAANAETTTTTITVNATTGDPAVPAVTLVNANGPALALNTLADEWKGTLQPGQLAATADGPLVGVTSGTTFLATGEDLFSMPVTLPVTPFRLLDLRHAAGRERIVGSSTNAFDSAGRLKGGAYLDVAVGDAGAGIVLDGLYGNVTVTGSTGSGYLTVYPPDGTTRPDASTLNWAATQTIANMVLVGATLSGTAYVVRIFATAATFVVLDCTGILAHLDSDSVTTTADAVAIRRAGLSGLLARSRRMLGVPAR